MNVIAKTTYILFLSCMAIFNASGQQENDLTTIKTRLFNSVKGSATYDLSRQNSDGTFTTVSYPESYPTDFTGGPRPHLSEMQLIATAYHTEGSQYKSPELLEAYVKAWDWWYHTNPTDNNWWYRSIGFPNSLIGSYLLMADEIKTVYPESYNTATTYLLAEWTPQFYAESLANPGGANTSDVAYYTFATSVTARVDSIVAQSAEVLTSLIEVQTTPKGEGIHPDYSFSAHSGTGRQLYLGNYGKEYIGGIIRFMIMTNDTYLEVSPERVTIFENLFLEGASWVAYRNIFDHHQHGRRVMPTDGYTKTLNSLHSLIQLNTPQKEKLQELYNWMSRSFEDSEINIQQGNRMYWRHDYMVHKGENYFTSNRMSSTRVICSESGNGEGLNNYYTGSSVNYIYLTGQEYLEFWDDMNWRRLPGITAPQKPMSTPLLTVGPTRPRALNEHAFAGGVSDGKTGTSGYIFLKTTSEVNLKLYKSTFYFNDYFVVLGSNITAGKSYGVPYTTTVNQVKFKDQFTVDNNGTATDVSPGQSLAPTTSNWAFLNDVGYQFIDNTDLNFEVQTIGSSDIAWMGFNHGNQPNNDGYAYAVYPNIDQTAFTGRLQENRFNIISNNAVVQAVSDTIANITQAIFFLPGKINLPGNIRFLSTNVSLAVQLRQQDDSVFLQVANPYCESIPRTSATITLDGYFEGDGAIVDTETGTTTVTIPLPQDAFQGSTVNIPLTQTTVSGLLDTNQTTASLLVYPSHLKAGNVLKIANQNTSGEAFQVQIYHMDGRLAEHNLNSQETDLSFNINTTGMSKGMYLLRYNGRTAKFTIY